MRIFGQAAFDRYRAREIQPGAQVQSDSQIDEFIRAKVESAYHPSCSCKMGGADDPMAVVDPDTRVYGIDKLRVVDSSIMPSVTTATSTLQRSCWRRKRQITSSVVVCYGLRTRRSTCRPIGNRHSASRGGVPLKYTNPPLRAAGYHYVSNVYEVIFPMISR